jgi:hypothetical protein
VLSSARGILGARAREEELARVRVMLAEAFQAAAEYKEFPYAIRRRRRDAPSEERVRLSEELRRVKRASPSSRSGLASRTRRWATATETS